MSQICQTASLTVSSLTLLSLCPGYCYSRWQNTGLRCRVCWFSCDSALFLFIETLFLYDYFPCSPTGCLQTQTKTNTWVLVVFFLFISSTHFNNQVYTWQGFSSDSVRSLPLWVVCLTFRWLRARLEHFYHHSAAAVFFFCLFFPLASLSLLSLG